MKKLINWWESLDIKIMDKLLGGYVWHGTTKERHIKLKEMYDKWVKETEQEIYRKRDINAK